MRYGSCQHTGKRRRNATRAHGVATKQRRAGRVCSITFAAAATAAPSTSASSCAPLPRRRGGGHDCRESGGAGRPHLQPLAAWIARAAVRSSSALCLTAPRATSCCAAAVAGERSSVAATRERSSATCLTIRLSSRRLTASHKAHGSGLTTVDGMWRSDKVRGLCSCGGGCRVQGAGCSCGGGWVKLCFNRTEKEMLLAGPV